MDFVFAKMVFMMMELRFVNLVYIIASLVMGLLAVRLVLA